MKNIATYVLQAIRYIISFVKAEGGIFLRPKALNLSRWDEKFLLNNMHWIILILYSKFYYHLNFPFYPDKFVDCDPQRQGGDDRRSSSSEYATEIYSFFLIIDKPRQTWNSLIFLFAVLQFYWKCPFRLHSEQGGGLMWTKKFFYFNTFTGDWKKCQWFTLQGLSEDINIRRRFITETNQRIAKRIFRFTASRRWASNYKHSAVVTRSNATYHYTTMSAYYTWLYKVQNRYLQLRVVH